MEVFIKFKVPANNPPLAVNSTVGYIANKGV